MSVFVCLNIICVCLLVHAYVRLNLYMHACAYNCACLYIYIYIQYSCMYTHAILLSSKSGFRFRVFWSSYLKSLVLVLRFWDSWSHMVSSFRILVSVSQDHNEQWLISGQRWSSLYKHHNRLHKNRQVSLRHSHKYTDGYTDYLVYGKTSERNNSYTVSGSHAKTCLVSEVW